MQKIMENYVAEFSEQLSVALDIAEGCCDVINERPIKNVVICGLGGSGIGGTILAQLLADHCSVPIVSVKDYAIPAFVDQETLVIACSYSGNTEETLEAVEAAMQVDAMIACVTSGGELGDLAVTYNWPIIKVPSGYPPRAAFGYAFPQLFRIAELYGLTRSGWQNDVKAAIELIDSEMNSIKNAARQLAESIQHKIPVIYTSTWLQGVAVRWCQQLEENSKMLAWHNVYPEMNHNELVGWAGGTKEIAVVFLLSDFDHERVRRRMELTDTVYRKKTPHVHHYQAKGKTKLQQALYLICLGDWLSVYLSDFRGKDPIEIEVINWLKGELAKF